MSSKLDDIKLSRRSALKYAGAGLVADSVPQSEWMETLNKGRAVIRAANAALTGFKDLKGPMVRS